MGHGGESRSPGMIARHDHGHTYLRDVVSSLHDLSFSVGERGDAWPQTVLHRRRFFSFHAGVSRQIGAQNNEDLIMKSKNMKSKNQLNI